MFGLVQPLKSGPELNANTLAYFGAPPVTKKSFRNIDFRKTPILKTAACPCLPILPLPLLPDSRLISSQLDLFVSWSLENFLAAKTHNGMSTMAKFVVR
jgi:hypothetical protein